MGEATTGLKAYVVLQIRQTQSTKTQALQVFSPQVKYFFKKKNLSHETIVILIWNLIKTKNTIVLHNLTLYSN